MYVAAFSSVQSEKLPPLGDYCRSSVSSIILWCGLDSDIFKCLWTIYHNFFGTSNFSTSFTESWKMVSTFQQRSSHIQYAINRNRMYTQLEYLPLNIR